MPFPARANAQVTVGLSTGNARLGSDTTNSTAVLGTSPSPVGLSVTCDVPAGRRLLIRWRLAYISAANPRVGIYEDGALICLWVHNAGENVLRTASDFWEHTPAGGNHTYEVRAYSAATGTMDLHCDETPGLLIVEDFGPA